MKMKEILEKQTDQLRTELVEKQKHLFDLRSQAITEKLDAYRADPRVAEALDTLRDTQASPPPPPRQTPEPDDDADFVTIYGNDRDW